MLIMFVYSDMFIAGCLKEMIVSAPRRWGYNSAETCRSYVKDCGNKLWNSAYVGVTCVVYYDECLFHMFRPVPFVIREDIYK